MEIGSKEFVIAINGSGFDAQFKAFAKHQLHSMKCFFVTEEGKKFYSEWIQNNQSLQRQYEVTPIAKGYDYDKDDDD